MVTKRCMETSENLSRGVNVFHVQRILERVQGVLKSELKLVPQFVKKVSFFHKFLERWYSELRKS